MADCRISCVCADTVDFHVGQRLKRATVHGRASDIAIQAPTSVLTYGFDCGFITGCILQAVSARNRTYIVCASVDSIFDADGDKWWRKGECEG